MPRVLPARVLVAAGLACLVAAAPAARALTITSSDLDAGQPVGQAYVFAGHGCTGGNQSPQVGWRDLPAGTKSLALTVFDPDAPNGGAGFWHWAVFDIPATADGLPRGAGAGDGHALPKGARQVANDFDQPGYGGPCPPAGKGHRYLFELYALKVPTLALGKEASAAEVAAEIQKNALGKATLMVRYGR